jgi:hypothetical protein
LPSVRPQPNVRRLLRWCFLILLIVVFSRESKNNLCWANAEKRVPHLGCHKSQITIYYCDSQTQMRYGNAPFVEYDMTLSSDHDCPDFVLYLSKTMTEQKLSGSNISWHIVPKYI